MKKSGFISIITSQLSRHITLVFAGNIFAAGLGFLAVLIISKHLSVSGFGLFNIALSTILITRLLANLGTDAGMIKFASSYLSTGKDTEANQVFKVSFLIRVIASSTLAIIVFFSAPILSEKILQQIISCFWNSVCSGLGLY